MKRPSRRAAVSSANHDEFLTTKELMQYLKVRHKQTIYKLVGKGLPAVLVGNNYRFLRREVVDFLKQNSRAELRK